MKDIAGFFGCDGSDVFEEKQQAEGYLAGTGTATRIVEAAFQELRDKPRAYKEAFFQGLRENI